MQAPIGVASCEFLIFTKQFHLFVNQVFCFATFKLLLQPCISKFHLFICHNMILLTNNSQSLHKCFGPFQLPISLSWQNLSFSFLFDLLLGWCAFHMMHIQDGGIMGATPFTMYMDCFENLDHMVIFVTYNTWIQFFLRLSIAFTIIIFIHCKMISK